MHRKSIPTTYGEARAMLKGRSSRKIANNTTLIDQSEGVIGLRLHSTVVVVFDDSGHIILNTGGYRTTTTKDRLNRVARAHGYSVFAKDFDWFVQKRGEEPIPFEDGFTIPAPEPVGTDARVENHGSVLLVRPLTDTAREWLKTNTDGTWFGGALAVEPRYACNLVAGMREQGFSVEAA